MRVNREGVMIGPINTGKCPFRKFEAPVFSFTSQAWDHLSRS